MVLLRVWVHAGDGTKVLVLGKVVCGDAAPFCCAVDDALDASFAGFKVSADCVLAVSKGSRENENDKESISSLGV